MVWALVSGSPEHRANRKASGSPEHCGQQSEARRDKDISPQRPSRNSMSVDAALWTRRCPSCLRTRSGRPDSAQGQAPCVFDAKRRKFDLPRETTSPGPPWRGRAGRARRGKSVFRGIVPLTSLDGPDGVVNGHLDRGGHRKAGHTCVCSFRLERSIALSSGNLLCACWSPPSL